MEPVGNKKAEKRVTRRIHIGSVPIGGGAPIAVQSMTNTDTRDVQSTVRQIEELFRAGCEIVRLAIPDQEAAEAFGEIKSRVKPPLIADIHFDHRLAIAALNQGADGLRINPGNIGGPKAVEKIIRVAAPRKTPIRIGVNAGSLSKEILEKFDQSFIFSDSEPHNMAELILEKYYILKENPDIWKRVSYKCRKFVERHYSWEKNVASIEKICFELSKQSLQTYSIQ